MKIDWTISIGVLLNLAGFVGIAIAGYYAIKVRMGLFEQSLHAIDERFEEGLRQHAAALERHADRFSSIDGEILRIVSDLSKLIGRSEVFFRERGGGVRGDKT